MKLGTLLKRVTDAMAVLAGVFLVAIVFIICIDVGMRYFFDRPQVWTVEICEYLVFAITFLGAPWLLRVGGHVNVDIVTERLSTRTRHVLNVVSALIGAVACLVLTYFGAVTAVDCFRSGVLEVKTLDVPKYYFMVVMSIGYLFLLAEFLRQLVGQIAHLREER